MMAQRIFFRSYLSLPWLSQNLNNYQLQSEFIVNQKNKQDQHIYYNSLGDHQQMGNCEGEQIIHDTHVPVLGRLGSVLDLKIVNCVWQKDYQGLFDYESKDIKQYTYHVKARSLVMYDKQKKIIKEINESPNQQTLKSAAFEVLKKSNYYQIQPIFIQSEQYTIQKLLWLIVKSVPHHRYPLKEKDIIKFGKQKVKVREIVHNDLNHHSSHDQNSIKTNKKVYDDLKFKLQQQVHQNNTSKQDLVQQIQSVATQNEQTCRICLQPGQFTNPLICACKCLGSVRYIHLNCLRTWLGKRLNVSKSKFNFVIKWTPLICQVCKKHFKYRIFLDNKKYYTVDIPKPKKPYVVLELMKKSTQFCKIFHFVSLAETSKVSIGRRKDIDIKISEDVSVSRHHANLIYDFEGKRFLLQDNKSKFGTLVLVSKNLLINPFQRGISFQMGGEVFIFDTQRGPGSIADYYDEVEYLNVRKVEEKVDDEQESDENNEDEDMEENDEEQEQQEEPRPTNISLNVPASHNNSQINSASIIIQSSQSINNSPIIVSSSPALVNNTHPQQAEILDA